jgi:hypothetical protein
MSISLLQNIINKETVLETTRNTLIEASVVLEENGLLSQELLEQRNYHIKELEDKTKSKIEQIINFEDFSNTLFHERQSGNNPIETIYEELSEHTTGVRGFFPHRKDWKHNENIHYLGKLIGEQNHLKKNGLLRWPVATYTAVGEGLLHGFALLGPGLDETVKLYEQALSGNPYSLGMAIILQTACIGSAPVAHNSAQSQNNFNGIKNAQILDKKLKKYEALR